jgi:hypothetical protein
MVGCQQKYCKHCVHPVLDENGKFMYGYCKISKHLVLRCDPEESENYDVLPLYCEEYTYRERKIDY